MTPSTSADILRAALRETCREGVAAELPVVSLVIALRHTWQAQAVPASCSEAEWDRLYMTILGECLTEHFSVEHSQTESPAEAIAPDIPLDHSRALCARADSLIRRAATALAQASQRTHYQIFLHEELAAHRAVLRALMTDIGRELRREGVARPVALALIEAAARQSSQAADAEAVVMAREAVTWAVEAFDAVA